LIIKFGRAILLPQQTWLETFLKNPAYLELAYTRCPAVYQTNVDASTFKPDAGLEI
jgi:hypothetical protein